MLFARRFGSLAALIAAVVWFAGCSSGNSGNSTPTGGTLSVEQERISAAMASLPPADRELAEKQQVCPVGGKLGLMGTPVKVTVEGRDVFLCCEHCEEELRKDPAKYLAKLPK